MRIKNCTHSIYWRNWFSITARDVMVVLWCLAWEHASLPAFWFLARNWRSVMAKRRQIMARRRVDDEYMAGWFKYTPVSMQAPRKFARLGFVVADRRRRRTVDARGADAHRTRRHARHSRRLRRL